MSREVLRTEERLTHASAECQSWGRRDFVLVAGLGLTGMSAVGRSLGTNSSAATAARAPSDESRSSRRLLLTPENRRVSPLTGYTRQHWLEITERLLAGILPHLDPMTGLPELKGITDDRGHALRYALDRRMAESQALERIMMLAVYYTAATGKDRIPGWAGSITAPFRSGIIRVSDPKDALHSPRTDPSVYLGSETALAALLSPKFFWEPLTAAQKENVLTFLQELAHMPSYDNNHHLFHMLPVPLLERHGRPSNRAHHTEMLKRILSWYRGDGWFIDGVNCGFDHYNFWGFQLYTNAVCHLDKAWRAQFGARFRAITSEFLQNARFFFCRDGGPIPWGRSLSYRFADVSAIGWAHVNGANPLAPGLARRTASGCLKYFWDHGALDENGVLELGYHAANAVVAEDYLTDGIDYFAAQGLACLLIPETDPFWTDTELPLPADRGGGRLALPGAQMVVRVNPRDGEARLFPVGQPFGIEGHWQRGIKYGQHAYSSDLGWCALGEGGEDLGAGRTGYSLNGKSWTFRTRPVARQIAADHVASVEPIDVAQPLTSTPGGQTTAVRALGPRRNLRNEPPHGGTSDCTTPAATNLILGLTTHTLIGDSGEIHIFWHNCAKAFRLYLGGYGINVDGERRLQPEVNDRRIHIQCEEKHSWMEQLDGPRGGFAYRVLSPREGWRHSHLFGGRGAFPFWCSTGTVGAHAPVIMYVDGARGRTPRTPPIRIGGNPTALEIEFEGKRHMIVVQ